MSELLSWQFTILAKKLLDQLEIWLDCKHVSKYQAKCVHFFKMSSICLPKKQIAKIATRPHKKCPVDARVTKKGHDRPSGEVGFERRAASLLS